MKLEAEATDNVSVTSVKLSYGNADGEWVDVDAKRKSGDFTKGTYEAVIPADALNRDNVTDNGKTLYDQP